MTLHTPPLSVRAPSVLPSYAATDLTGDGTTALIEHNGQIYTLRITRAGKLILNK